MEEELKKQLKEGMSMVFEVMASEELSSAIAKMAMNIYKAFLKEGFDKEQAMKLTIGIMSKEQGK